MIDLEVWKVIADEGEVVGIVGFSVGLRFLLLSAFKLLLRRMESGLFVLILEMILQERKEKQSRLLRAHLSSDSMPDLSNLELLTLHSSSFCS